ncbi:uncharacterized protein LOC119482413 isoform X2 [Sebastes umbrosus]|uniref:uncharacterized protein LOC119482413 isoform X2 n=1 Tax=Sebastes umbrosus TaxID=72105 RepID=UPI00189E7850|nr:uncharacterized protein LOC119482413 isoform X2 [Sebastes umbrosus]
MLHNTDAMATDTRSSQTTPEIREQDVRPLFESFLGRLTVERQVLLKQGKPDCDTKVMIVSLLLDIIGLVTKCISETEGVNAITSEDVRSSLGDTLHRVLAVVLNVNVQVNCESTTILTDMIAEEVARRFNRSSDVSSDTLFDRLDEMVLHVRCSFKAFMAKMRGASRRSEFTKPSSQLIKQHRLDIPTNQDGSVESETPGETFSRGSQDNLTTPTDAVQGLIRKKLGELAGPFLDVMEDSERELLQSDIDRETESFAKDIAIAVDELVESLGAKDAMTTGPESKTRVQQLWKETMDKIKMFSAKHYAKQLKEKFLHSATAESDKSIQSFSRDIENLILPEDHQQAGNEAVLHRLHIFRAQLLHSSGGPGPGPGPVNGLSPMEGPGPGPVNDVYPIDGPGLVNGLRPIEGPGPLNGLRPIEGPGPGPVNGLCPIEGPGPLNGLRPIEGPGPVNGLSPVEGQGPVNGLSPVEGPGPVNGLRPIEGPGPENGLCPVEGPGPVNGLCPVEGPGPVNGLCPIEGPGPGPVDGLCPIEKPQH